MRGRKVSLGVVAMIVVLTIITTFNITYFLAAEYYNNLFSKAQELELQYGKLAEIASAVEKYFVGDYDKQALEDGAAAGYIDALGDRWSGYYTADQVRQIRENSANEYVGIGVSVSAEDDGTYTILNVTPASPAEKVGLQALDVITTVDGKDVREMASLTELTMYVKGEKGTKVRIGVERSGEYMEFSITRDAISEQVIISRMLTEDIGYIRIVNFNENADVQFAKALDELAKDGAQAFVFDVRFNGGGYASVMKNILNKLLPEGVIISMIDKAGNSKEYTSDAKYLDLPIMVLVNKYTISAAEFFAAAIQEYGVGTIIGDKTSGKGYAQELIEFSDGSGINLSVWRYYTPKGVSLAGVGVTPDNPISLPKEVFDNFGKITDEQDVQLQKAMEILEKKLAAEQPPAAD